MDYNLWKSGEWTPTGEKEYRRLISAKLRDILKNALESLKKDGIIRFENLYKVIPDKEVVMEDGGTRPRSRIEEAEGWETHCADIEKDAALKNSVLDADLVKHLIFGYDYSYSLEWLVSPKDAVEATPE